jgi:radical SAM superfamily enzyme with C-terminal helix-hairpin-helix motif
MARSYKRTAAGRNSYVIDFPVGQGFGELQDDHPRSTGVARSVDMLSRFAAFGLRAISSAPNFGGAVCEPGDLVRRCLTLIGGACAASSDAVI